LSAPDLRSAQGQATLKGSLAKKQRKRASRLLQTPRPRLANASHAVRLYPTDARAEVPVRGWAAHADPPFTENSLGPRGWLGRSVQILPPATANAARFEGAAILSWTSSQSGTPVPGEALLIDMGEPGNSPPKGYDFFEIASGSGANVA
jgi:hypothetical protein